MRSANGGNGDSWKLKALGLAGSLLILALTGYVRSVEHEQETLERRIERLEASDASLRETLADRAALLRRLERDVDWMLRRNIGLP